MSLKFKKSLTGRRKTFIHLTKGMGTGGLEMRVKKEIINYEQGGKYLIINQNDNLYKKIK